MVSIFISVQVKMQLDSNLWCLVEKTQTKTYHKCVITDCKVSGKSHYEVLTCG